MLHFNFWFLYLATPVLMLFLLNIAGEKINRVSLVNIVTLSIYAFSIVGTMPLFYHLDDYRLDTGVVDENLIFKILILSSMNIIFLLIGVIFSRRVLCVKSENRIHTIERLGHKQIISLFALFIISLITVFLYISKLDSVALLVALTSGVKEAGVSRSQMGNDFSGKYHWYRLLMHDISQLVAFILFANWLVYKSKRLLIYLTGALLLASFNAIISTEKGPMAWFLVGLFFVYILVKKNGTISIRPALKFAAVLVVSLVLMYIYFMNSSDPLSAFLSILSRSITGQITTAYFYIQYFYS